MNMLLKGSYRKIAPASGAIIMANGIFLIGAIKEFPILDDLFGVYLAFILLIVWIYIYTRLSIQFFHRDFLIPFLKHPVNSFAMGTWIAGVSVLCNVFLRYFPKILPITQAISILNTFLFLFFFINCIYNFKQLFSTHRNFPVHGIVLLSTVGTQSIVVLLNNVFFEMPKIFSSLVILVGIIFYLLGFALIIKRYLRQKNWTLADDWNNTNCIIHGALSITGLAIVSSNTFSSGFVVSLWLIIFIFIMIVEALEIVRAVMRIRLYGWQRGIFHYHVTQWSRNFTIGMFYAFTSVMVDHPNYLLPSWLDQFLISFMPLWALVVLLVLLGEIAIYIHSRLTSRKMIKKERFLK